MTKPAAPQAQSQLTRALYASMLTYRLGSVDLRRIVTLAELALQLDDVVSV